MSAKDLLKTFEQALARLEQVMNEPKTSIVRDAAIQRFEFMFELAWKATQRFLRDEGIVWRSPKGCLQEAFSLGVVADSPLWIRMIEDRNLTVHTYSERTAEVIFSHLKEYLPLFRELLNGVSARATKSDV